MTIDPDRLLAAGGVDILSRDFHRAHEHIFAFSDAQSPIEVIAWRVAVRFPVAAHSDLKLDHPPMPAQAPQWRRAYFPRAGWLEVAVLAFGAIEPGKRIDGPAIVEFRSSIVLDSSAAFSRSAGGDLVVEPGGARGASDRT